MKKIISIILGFCLVFSAILFCGCENEQTQENTKSNINIVAFGDSISAGYGPQNSEMYSYYNNYVIGRTKINEKCFSYVLANSLRKEEVTIDAISYAQSGDTTTDFINKLNDRKTYPDLLTDTSRADIITLCIGANNVLAPTLDNLSDLMIGAMATDDLETLLIAGYNKFKDDYTNSIIPVLTRSNAQIYVMTIYDPFKYASLLDINMTGELQIDLTAFQEKFIEVKNLAIKYLNKINDYIKSQLFDNVFVVDINSYFDKISKADYGLYLNVDTSKITLEINNFLDLMTLETTLASNIYFDPHPTIYGQEYIASLFFDAISKNNQNF